MAFALSHFTALVYDHASALAYYHDCTPWRGDPDDAERPLKHNRKRHMGVRLDRQGNVIFRLHRTDVVTYTTAGTIKLQTYRSMSTDAFANSLTPPWLLCGFNSGYLCFGSVWNGGGKLYALTPHMEIDLETRIIVSGKTKWVRERVNVKRANAARKKYDFAAFKAFIAARDTLLGMTPRLYHYDALRYAGPHERLRLLAHKDQWETLAANTHPDELVKWLNSDILRTEGCYDTETCEYLANYNRVRAWR